MTRTESEWWEVKDTCGTWKLDIAGEEVVWCIAKLYAIVAAGLRI